MWYKFSNLFSVFEHMKLLIDLEISRSLPIKINLDKFVNNDSRNCLDKWIVYC